jgi:hypothetical protein
MVAENKIGASPGAAHALDFFILHADQDAEFVKISLASQLGERVMLSSELPLGTTVITALERGVVTSRVTVVVLSLAFLRDSWSVFGEELAGFHATRGGLLVPLVVEDCVLPLRLEFRTRLDCRDALSRAAAAGRLRELLDLPEPAPLEIPCPYPGMRPYTADNAALFCGRDADIAVLVGLVAGGVRELYVIGPSGSGKSSLLQSGVAPRLQRTGDAVVREPFDVHVLRPGSSPDQRLAPVIAALRARPARTLVVIDQLEELFTLADDAGRRAAAAQLDELRAIPTCHLAFTVRADFRRALRDSELGPRFESAHHRELEALRGDDLRTALAEPARRVGVVLESRLLDDLLDDASGEPGALPLIQEALVYPWASRDGSVLTAAQYAAMAGGAAHGLAFAMSLRADISFAALGDAGRATAQRVFLRLVSFGEGRAHTRRQQPASALRAGEPPEQFRAALQHLAESRLLTLDGDPSSGEVLVDLSHETLITAWPRLEDWIDRLGTPEQQRRHLEIDAAEWARRPAGDRTVGLLDDTQLRELDGWFTEDIKREIGASKTLDGFITASRDASEKRQRDRRRLIIAACAALAVVVVGLIAGIFSIQQQKEIAETATQEAVRQKNHAVEQAQIAKAATEQASAKAEQLARELSRAQILQAAAFVDAGRLAAARALLLMVREADRAWEWVYLVARCGFTPLGRGGLDAPALAGLLGSKRDDTRVIECGGESARSLDVKPSDSHLAPLRLLCPIDDNRRYSLVVKSGSLDVLSIEAAGCSWPSDTFVTDDQSTLIMEKGQLAREQLCATNTGDIVSDGTNAIPLPHLGRPALRAAAADSLERLASEYPDLPPHLDVDSTLSTWYHCPPDSPCIVISRNDGTASLWRGRDKPPTVFGAGAGTPRPDSGAIDHGACISPDHRYIFSYPLRVDGQDESEDGRGQLFELATGQRTMTTPDRVGGFEAAYFVSACSFDPTSRAVARVFQGRNETRVEIWDTRSGDVLYAWIDDRSGGVPVAEGVRGIAWADDGSLFAIAFFDRVEVYDRPGGLRQNTNPIPLGASRPELGRVPAFALRYSPDRTRILNGTALVDSRDFSVVLTLPERTEIDPSWSTVVLHRDGVDEIVSLRFWPLSQPAPQDLTVRDRLLRRELQARTADQPTR